VTDPRRDARTARTIARRGLLLRVGAVTTTAALALSGLLIAASTDLASGDPGPAPTVRLVRPTDASPDLVEQEEVKPKRSKKAAPCDCPAAPPVAPAPVPQPIPAPAPAPAAPVAPQAPPAPAPPAAPTSSGAQGGLLLVPPTIGNETGVGK
jgi:hypothetical protein